MAFFVFEFTNYGLRKQKKIMITTKLNNNSANQLHHYDGKYRRFYLINFDSCLPKGDFFNHIQHTSFPLGKQLP